MMLADVVNCRADEPICFSRGIVQQQRYFGEGLKQVAWRWQRQRAGGLRCEETGRKSSVPLEIRCNAPNIGQQESEEVVLKSELPVLVEDGPNTPCDMCNSKGWMQCDFCKGQKVNVQVRANKFYRRCPSCRAVGVVICPKCKVFKCVTFPDGADGSLY